ncbi:MAG: hypothetical protein HY960_03650 [Ignavibacteriae bacterium]|nr:hypothetical protein [Ignavibacteriota bacterium]
MLRKFITELKRESEHLNWGREIVVEFASNYEQFAATNSFFHVLETKGANFYPFPVSIAKILSNIFPSMSVGLFFCLRRTQKQGAFVEVLQQNFFQTNYFDGTTR